MDGRRIAERFEEVEIEPVDGDERDLNRLKATLVAAGAEPGNGTPRAFRALAVPKPSRPLLVPDQDVVRAALEENAVELARNDPGTRLGYDTEDLHRFRVATRRLRRRAAGRPAAPRPRVGGRSARGARLARKLARAGSRPRRPRRAPDGGARRARRRRPRRRGSDPRTARGRARDRSGDPARGARDAALLRAARRARGGSCRPEVQRRGRLGDRARRAGVRPAREGREGARAGHLRRRPARHPRPRQAHPLLRGARGAARRLRRGEGDRAGEALPGRDRRPPGRGRRRGEAAPAHRRAERSARRVRRRTASSSASASAAGRPVRPSPRPGAALRRRAGRHGRE